MVRKIGAYVRETVKLLFYRSDCFNIGDLVKYFPVWWSTLNGERTPLTDQTPWICFAAIDYLDDILTKKMRVYEFGSGGSTLFFAKRVKEVVSIEHNPTWFDRVVKEVHDKKVRNCHVVLHEAEPDPASLSTDRADPDAYVSDDENYRGMTFKKYASSIDDYPDEYFDIVLIDGRVRPSCCKHVMSKVNKGGYLILDNAERPYYAYVHKSLDNKNWKKIDFFGPLPNVLHFSETCLWQKLDS